jgi:hypothetical protein
MAPGEGRRTRWRRLLRLLPVAVPLLLFIFTGLRGINFGFHWDEKEHQLDPARTMIKTGVLLPRAYIYPSFNRILTLVPVAPTAVEALRDETKSAADVQAAILKSMDRPIYPLAVRAVFLVTSSLAILWLYLLILSWRQSVAEALIGASLLGLSWEFAYHARWTASDCIVAQFGALSLLFAMRSRMQPRRPIWLFLGAAAAGLAAGSKYPGAILILPVLIAAFQSERGPGSFKRIARRYIQLFVCFSIVYLMTTPGTLLDPVKFFADLKFARVTYKTGWHGYTVEAGLPHFLANLAYLALSFFSPYKALAALVFGASVFGLYRLTRDSIGDAAVVVVTPLLYLAYFSFGQSVMVVRNLLLFGPFLALLAARGLMDLYRLLRPRALKVAAAAALAGILVVNGVWLVRSAESIRHRARVNFVAQAVEYMRAHPDDSFFVSKRVLDAARAASLDLPPNIVSSADKASHVMIYTKADGPGHRKWKSNDPWLTVAVFGPKEVNSNYYATWRGDDRVFVMTIEKARERGVPMVLSVGDASDDQESNPPVP